MQPMDDFGRLYAVYGGFFILLSFLWGRVLSIETITTLQITLWGGRDKYFTKSRSSFKLQPFMQGFFHNTTTKSYSCKE